jgi:carbon-monoxide dehydrogenase large subunit
MNELVPPKFGMGAATRRLEDTPLITGHGRYPTDVMPEGALVGYVVRSAAGHARISVGDLDEARAAPGVHLVWTAADIGDLGTLPCLGMGEQKDGSPIDVPPYYLLCGDVVRRVGDGIAFIVADDLNAAKAAGDLIAVDYDLLPAAIGAVEALAADAPLVWPEKGSNVAFEYELGDAEASAAAFAAADKIARLRIINNRLVCNYMEPRAIVAEYDADSDHFTLTLGTQGVHDMRTVLASVLSHPAEKIRVITPDVGGGFGTKAFGYPEYPLVAKAAKTLDRPVRWACERSEHFLVDAHGRDNIAEAAVALDGDGRIVAMKVDLIANMGCYLSQFAPFIPWLGLSMSTGVYDIGVVHATCKGVYTNTAPVDAYRGAGRPEAAYLIERLVDEAARVCGLSRTEIRRRNFVRPDQMPYTSAMKRTYDTGEFAAHMDQAMTVSDADGFAGRAAQAKARGKVRGFGFATYVEACAFAGSEPAKVVLEDDGSVTLHIGTQSNGQGHQTAYAQFVAGPLGLDYDRIRVVQGDTDKLASGGGTGGSRSIPIGVPSVDRAARTLADQLKEMAADQLESAVADIELVDGMARIVGTDRHVSYAALAAAAPERDKLTAIGEIKQDEATYPNGTHVCEVEIDPETGHTEIIGYTIVDDFGVVVNPLLLAGQIHGGVAQGIGQALLEHTVYDGDGQLLTASFQDYTMPRAADLPMFHFDTRNVPSTWNALGIKGAGEAGSIGSCPAVMNAVVDALGREYGITHIDMPATPLRVWEAIQAATG